MTRSVDILDAPYSLRGPFLAAMTLHGTVLAGLILYGYMSRGGQTFGAPDAGGGAVGVEAVDKIPLAHQGPQNPVANDSQSQIPQTPVTKPVERSKVEPPDPDAVPLKNKRAKLKPSEVAATRQVFRNYDKLMDNQLTTKMAPQVSSTMFSPTPGSGRIGTGLNTTLGNRFPAYAAQIQSLVAQHWRTGDVDANIKNGPVVIATFDLMRDGSTRNLVILQGSGIPSLDNSVKRAILDASPFPPIPNGYDKDYAKVEFSFELKR
jgi:TonB family protein